MGYTSSLVYCFFRKVPNKDLKVLSAQIVKEINSLNNKSTILLENPVDNSNSAYDCNPSAYDEHMYLRQLVCSKKELEDSWMYILFESWCPLLLQDYTQKMSIEFIEVECAHTKNLFLDNEDDDDDDECAYILIGGFGYCWNGKLGGGIRYKATLDEENVVDFLMNIETLKQYPIYYGAAQNNETRNYDAFFTSFQSGFKYYKHGHLKSRIEYK